MLGRIFNFARQDRLSQADAGDGIFACMSSALPGNELVVTPIPCGERIFLGATRFEDALAPLPSLRIDEWLPRALALSHYRDTAFSPLNASIFSDGSALSFQNYVEGRPAAGHRRRLGAGGGL